MKISRALLAAAVSGITVGLQAAAWGGTASASQVGAFDVQNGGTQLDADAGMKHACKGQNACKGQGGCKTASHACKGQNDCKGQGGCSGKK